MHFEIEFFWFLKGSMYYYYISSEIWGRTQNSITLIFLQWNEHPSTFCGNNNGLLWPQHKCRSSSAIKQARIGSYHIMNDTWKSFWFSKLFGLWICNNDLVEGQSVVLRSFYMCEPISSRLNRNICTSVQGCLYTQIKHCGQRLEIQSIMKAGGHGSLTPGVTKRRSALADGRMSKVQLSERGTYRNGAPTTGF